MANSDSFYVELVEEVDIILAQFGKRFKVRSPGGYDPGSMTTLAGGEREVVGVVDNSFAMSISEMTGRTWTATRTLLLAASGNIKANEEVEVDGRWFALSKVEKVKPADIVVIYMLDLNR